MPAMAPYFTRSFTSARMSGSFHSGDTAIALIDDQNEGIGDGERVAAFLVEPHRSRARSLICLSSFSVSGLLTGLPSFAGFLCGG